MASRLPLNTAVVPIVAELPTAKNTLAALAPLVKSTRRPDVITNVEPIWKMKTAFAFPPPSSVRSPDETASEDAAVYTPGSSVCPPILPDTAAPPVRLIASLYAAVRSTFA
jgi:hypothetical protein